MEEEERLNKDFLGYLSESNVVALSSCLPAGGQAPHQPLDSVLQLRTQTPLLVHLFLHSVRCESSYEEEKIMMIQISQSNSVCIQSPTMHMYNSKGKF